MMIGLLLMAAGRSQRFKATHNGMHKLLYPMNDSFESMLETTYKTASQVFSPENICIIVNQEEQEVQKAAQKLASPTLSIQSNGIGESLAQAIHAHQHYDGLLILHADLPFIQAATIQSVHDALQSHDIVRPVYKEKCGHPVGFQKQRFAELIQLKGDEGANKILRNFTVHSLSVEDPGIIYDIDTLHDFNNRPMI